MFKPQVLRRSFSSFTRLSHPRLIRSAAHDGAESITIQRVHIRTPFFTRSRVFSAFVFAGVTYGFAAGLNRWLDEEEDEENRANSNNPGRAGLNGEQNNERMVRGTINHVNNDDEDDEEYDDALLFLPTGFSRPKPRTYYRGSDPEWQEFVRIAPDRKRMEGIKGELISTVRTFAVRNPSWEQRMGKINPNVGEAWIEYKFPDGPPIEYERPGVELTEDLSWRKATRPVEELHHRRLSNALVPSAVANPLYKDWRRRTADSWNGFKSYMGWEVKSDGLAVPPLVQIPPPNPTSLPRPALPPPTPPPKTPTDSSTPAASDARQSQEPSSSSPLGDQASARLGIAGIGIGLPNVKSLTMDLSQFRRDVQKERTPHKVQPPRGSFLVFGIVEIIGERAKLTLNVAAAYDPKSNQYVMMSMAIRNLTDFRQFPRGGP